MTNLQKLKQSKTNIVKKIKIFKNLLREGKYAMELCNVPSLLMDMS